MESIHQMSDKERICALEQQVEGLVELIKIHGQAVDLLLQDCRDNLERDKKNRRALQDLNDYLHKIAAHIGILKALKPKTTAKPKLELVKDEDDA